MNKEPISTIIHLENVDNIKIISLLNGESIVRRVLYDKNEINKFLMFFKPSNKTNEITKSQIENFSKNGEIIISFANNDVPLVIDLDINNGYRVVISTKQYYEQFTYQVGRYILESFSE